jgi:RNA polymerase sigma-70 factor (ECF subfamily)
MGIASYSGRGELRAWFRITATREVLRLVKGARKDQPLDDEALYDVFSPADSPELGHIKALYRAEFVAAFREAIASLTAKERTLLRQQALDGLSVDQLGTLYGVHRATVARWVAKARQKLLSRTRRSLMVKLKIGGADLDSILRLVRSRIDLSLDRFLVLSREIGLSTASLMEALIARAEQDSKGRRTAGAAVADAIKLAEAAPEVDGTLVRALEECHGDDLAALRRSLQARCEELTTR